MSDDHAGLLITLSARAENVAVVRHAVAGLAEELGVGEPTLGDLKTVVTEACMNVVVHAYDGGPGPLRVEAFPEAGGLTVIVSDKGGGIRPRADVERPSLRLGLTLIAALSSSFAISGGLGRGTEIRMHLSSEVADDNAAGDGREIRTPASAELEIGSTELIAPILARVVGVLGARNPIPIDRLSDATLLTDALSERVPEAFGERPYSFSLSDQEGAIELRVGPVPAGASSRLREGLAVPEVGGSLEKLADDVRVEEGEAGEYLLLRFATQVG